MNHKSFRFSERDAAQLAELAEARRETETAVIRALIHEAHAREIPMSSKYGGINEVPELYFEDTTVGRVAFLRYNSTGMTFTPDDWQGPQPESLDEVVDFNWIHHESGQAAVLVNGYPHIVI